MEEKERIHVMAGVAIAKGAYEKAREILAKSLIKYRDDAGILTQLSVVYELLEDFKKSREMLEEALRSDPDYPRAHYIRGIDCQNEGDLEQAEKEFQLAIENYPHYNDLLKNEHLSEAHTNLGTVHYLLGKHEDALREWGLGVTYDRNNSEASSNLKRYSKDKTDEVETGKNVEYFIDRGCELSESGRLIESLRVLLRAYALKPKHPLVHYNIGLVYGKLGDLKSAQKHLEIFIRAAPHHTEVSKIKDLVRKIKRGDFA